MEILFFLMLMSILVAGGLLVWHYTRSDDVLQHWAAQNNFRVIKSKYAHLNRGPFFWTSSEGQSVYRVVVEDQDGHTRSGWVRCGSWMWGVMSDEAEVRWDD